MRLFLDKIGIALFAASMCFATAASASVIVSDTEVGNNVVFSYEGSLDLTGLSIGGSGTQAFGWIGDRRGSTPVFYALDGHSVYQGTIVAPLFNASLATDGVVSGDSSGFQGSFVYTNVGYTSGTAINGSLTFANRTLADMGFAFGETFITTTPNDTITLNIGTVSAVPLPAGLPLLLVGLGAFGLIARRKPA